MAHMRTLVLTAFLAIVLALCYLQGRSKFTLSARPKPQSEVGVIVSPIKASSAARIATGGATATSRRMKPEDSRTAAAKKHLQGEAETAIRKLLQERVNIANIETTRPQVFHEMEMLQVVAGQYREIVGDLPGEGNSEISKALLGANPKGAVFIHFPPTRIGPSGELIDPWGTPFEMRVKNNTLEIRSAGPDAQFYTADDSLPTP